MTMQVRRNRSQRQKLVAEFREGGLGRHAFCRLNGIAHSTLDLWLRELAEVSAFVPVRIEPSKLAPREENSLRGAAARIVGARGVILEFGSESDAAWVAEICGRLL